MPLSWLLFCMGLDKDMRRVAVQRVSGVVFRYQEATTPYE